MSSRKLKLQDAKDKDAFPWVGSLMGGAISGDGLAGMNISMQLLAGRLGRYLDRPVIDRTGLQGSYDFKFVFSEGPADATYAPDQVVPCIFSSVKGIGLDLKSTKGQVETIVIDHIERPSEN
jgi:uncharacterized protein (TIGR03435 family)